MREMTAREALYTLCVKLGPIPTTLREDNLSPDEIRVNEAVRVLMDSILEEEVRRESGQVVELIDLIRGWHHARNLIDGATDKDQYMKLIQEAGELSDNICKGKDIRDDIGDMMVVLINIAERNNLTVGQCLQTAWDDIKDRKGTMVDGVFIKEGDDLPAVEEYEEYMMIPIAPPQDHYTEYTEEELEMHREMQASMFPHEQFSIEKYL
jgi:hypothetical protein